MMAHSRAARSVGLCLLIALLVGVGAAPVVGGPPEGLGVTPEATDEWECWGPGLPDPCRNALQGVSIVPGTDGAQAMAVGDKGTGLLFKDGAWAKTSSASNGLLRDVYMLSATDGWAVGLEGTIVHWNGTSWQTASSPTGDWFRCVAFPPDGTGTGWAAADKYGIGYFIEYTGSSWQIGSGSSAQRFGGTIYDIALVSDSDGFAVGSVFGGAGMIGQIHQMTGDEWSAMSVPTVEPLYGIDAISTTDAWACGDEGTLLHWNGAAWSVATSPSEDDLRGIDIVAANDVWAVGEYGTILHYDGSGWSTVSSPVSQDLNDVAFVWSAHGWAVGDGGTIIHWDGTSWATWYTPTIDRLERVRMTPATYGGDGWIAGNRRTLLHWNGSTWEERQGPFGSYYDVSAASRNDVWAAGSRKFAHWDGTGWTTIDRDNSGHALAAVSANDVWAVGWSTLQHYDGSAWADVPCPIQKTFYDIDYVSPTQVIAVGDGGSIMHWDGATWTQKPSGITGWISGVGCIDGLAFAVGTYGTILKWNGSSWSEMDSPTSSMLRGAALAATDTGNVGWAVGDAGQILRWNGSTWLEVDSPTGNDLWDVDMASATEAWAVGDGGVILHYGATAAPAMDNVIDLPMVLR